MKRKLTIAGLLIGSLVGFPLRPSVPLVGQFHSLPWLPGERICGSRPVIAGGMREHHL